MSLGPAPDSAPVPPQNLEAEESVLGAMLLSAGAIDVCAELLAPDDFYRQTHATIFKAATDMHAAGGKVDAITLTDELERRGQLEEVGGRVRLHELGGLVPATANAGHYARIVRGCAIDRSLIRVGGEISRLGWERVEDGPEQAEGKVYALAHARQQGGQVDVPATVRTVYDELVAQDGKPTRELIGVPTGLVDLDRVTRGFRKGSLVTVAADTGRGKSALWLNAALHNLRLGHPVAAFSLEMSEIELTHRAISLESGVPHDRITRGEIRPDEWGKLTDACDFLVSAPLYLRTDATIRPAGIRSELRRWQSRNPDGAFAVVDYLQLLTPDERSDNRVVDVSAISRSLKVTAMTLGLPIVAVSQLRRRMNPNLRPHRNDLRESGSIENDSDVVILIHHDDEKPGVAELIVAKNRHGAEATVSTSWTGPLMRFSSLLSEARAA